MFRTTVAALVVALQTIIDTIFDTATPTHVSVKLAQAPFAPTPTSVPGDFTEADYTGYAAKTVSAWADAYVVGGGIAETVSLAVQEFRPTGTGVTNSIGGYWLEAGDGTFLGGEAFDAPIPLTGPLSVINLVPKWQMGPTDFSAALIP